MMRGRRGIVPLIGRVFCTVSLTLLAACTAEAPTAPKSDPLVGTWIGTIVDPFTTRMKDESFTLTVQAGGVVSATGYMWYDIDNLPVYMTLTFRGEIDPEGAISGEGEFVYDRYYWINATAIGWTGYAGRGEAFGQLEIGTGLGNGYLRLSDETGYLDLEWNVEKDDGS